MCMIRICLTVTITFAFTASIFMPHMLAYSEVPSEWARDKTFSSETSSPAYLMKNVIVLRWTEMNHEWN